MPSTAHSTVFLASYDPDGTPAWDTVLSGEISPCGDTAIASTLAIGSSHVTASARHHRDLAFDENGNLVSSARTPAHPEPTESRIDAIAVEPTGEVVFVTSATHAFAFGNGLLPHAGAHDVFVAKLDSSTGRNGEVLLAREAP